MLHPKIEMEHLESLQKQSEGHSKLRPTSLHKSEASYF